VGLCNHEFLLGKVIYSVKGHQGTEMKIIAIIWKDIIMRFSDRSEILFFLVLPVLFTYFLSGGAVASGERSIPLLVVDEDDSALSAILVDELSGAGIVEPKLVTLTEAGKLYDDEQAVAWLTIPAGFEAVILKGLDPALEFNKAQNSNDADAAERVVLAAVEGSNRAAAVAYRALKEAEVRQPFENESARGTYFEQALLSARSMGGVSQSRVIITRPEIQTTISYDPVAIASAGQMVTWVLIPLLGTSALFVYERRLKTLPRLLTTPTPKAIFLLGTISGQLSVAVVQMFILIGFGAMVMNVQWGRSPSGLALMMFSFGLAAVAMGTMLGTFVKTEKQANNLSIMLGMLMALLGGCWWPLEIFPETIRTAVMVLPTTWAMQGFSGIVLHGQQLIDIYHNALVLIGFAGVFFLVGVKRFRLE
jgi:ABC-2 type transport system permease protein